MRIQNSQRQTLSSQSSRKDLLKSRIVDTTVIFILLVSFGFPGKYTMLLGSASSKILEYASFGAQLLLMLFSSSEDGFMSLKLLDLKEKYAVIYFMAAVYFLDSMLVTRYPSEQLISCIRYTATIFFALWMVEYYDGEKLFHLIAAAQVIFTCLTFAFMLLRPGAVFSQEQGEHDFTGFLRTKNNAASQFSICILLQIAWFRILRAKQMIVSRKYLLSLLAQGIFLVLCNAKGAVLCLIFPLLYVLFGKYKEEPGKRLPLGVIYVTLSVAFLITALTILPLFQPLFSLIGKDATLTGRPVVAADHPGYDQPAYIYRIWIWNVLEGPTGSCHGPSGIFTKFFYGKHDNRRPQCFAGIVDECRSVWSCRVFYGYDHFHHRSRADGMDRLSVQCGVYPVVYGIWLDRTFNVHL